MNYNTILSAIAAIFSNRTKTGVRVYIDVHNIVLNNITCIIIYKIPEQGGKTDIMYLFHVTASERYPRTPSHLFALIHTINYIHYICIGISAYVFRSDLSQW